MMKIKNGLVSLKIGNKQYDFKNLILSNESLSAFENTFDKVSILTSLYIFKGEGLLNPLPTRIIPWYYTKHL